MGWPWHKKEKPLPTMIGMNGGATSFIFTSSGYTNPGEWTRVLNQPGDPAAAGAYVPGTIDTSGYRALLIFGISGGGGGGANGNDNGAGGGGGGGYVQGHVADVTDVDEVTYRIPGGGAGGVGDAHGPPTGWPARQNGGDSPTLGLGPPTSYNDLFAVSGGSGGKGGYVEGGSGNSGGSGAPDGGYPTGTAGGNGGRNVSCDNPPDGGNPGSAVAAQNGGGGGGGAAGTWCSPTGRTGTPGYNSSIGGPNTVSTFLLPPAFPVGGGSSYPLDVSFESHGTEGTDGGPGSAPAPPGTPKAPAEGGDGHPGGSGGGGVGGGVEFYGTGNTGYGGGGGGAASRGGDAASGGDGGAGYLIVYAQ